jgi:predicted PurR-regulated permease PerM
MSLPPQPGGSVQGSQRRVQDGSEIPRANWSHRFRSGALAREDGPFIRRVLIAIGLFGLAYFFWSIGRVLLLAFAAILIAVLLDGLAGLIARWTPVAKRWALPAAVLIVAAVVLGSVLLFGAQIAGQIRQVLDQLPAAADAVGERVGIPNATARVEDAVAAGAKNNIMSRVAGIGFTIIGVASDLLLVIVAGIYLAASPAVYRSGVAKLFPPSKHDNIFGAFDAVAIALRLWSGGQLVAMLLVGVATGVAFWLIGLPLPLALGAIAGLTNFIPFIGPILGSIPALIFASTIGSAALIWTVVAVLAIQQVEGNVITPMIQRRAVELPPAVALFAIVVFGLLFGVLGVLLAVPLAVALMVLVKKLWVREALGEHTNLPGEQDAAARVSADRTAPG